MQSPQNLAMKHSITLLGAGNVGYHLAKKLHQEGHTIHQVFSRNSDRFANIYPTICQNVTTDLAHINAQADIYIIAVSDDAIKTVAEQLNIQKKIVVHTSGASPMTQLQMHPNHGIFYPLQTFTRNKPIDFSHLPICIDGSNEQVKNTLFHLAQTLTQSVYPLTDEQRQALHVAAVFANNFTNHLLAIADDICKTHEVPFEILKPLIRETFEKIQVQTPQNSQTGPAIRGDKKTIEKHLALLATQDRYAQLYQLLTQSIQSDFKS